MVGHGGGVMVGHRGGVMVDHMERQRGHATSLGKREGPW